MTPPPVTVIVPYLADVTLGFVVVLMIILPLFSPLSGVTVSHEGSLLLAVHDTVDNICTVCWYAEYIDFQLVLSSSSGVAVCVTEIVRVFPPLTTVIVPLLDSVPTLFEK